MNPKSQDNYTQSYNKWILNPSPDNLADLVSSFAPTINAELQQYAGPKELLRSRAKHYVVQAIRSYDPMGKTRLNSWVVTNLKQLSRYGKRLRPIRASEDLIRNSAELNRVTSELEDKLGRKPTEEELQDSTGWSSKTIKKIREASIAPVTQNAVVSVDSETGPDDPSVYVTDTTPYLSDAVYMSLSDRDKNIFDYKTGAHGKQRISGKEIAEKLKVTPAYISQRSADIGSLISKLGGLNG